MIKLFENKWLSLRQTNDGYVYSHEDRCNGQIVAILPFRYTEHGVEYLIRKEWVPCWNWNLATRLRYDKATKKEYPLFETIITGGVEEGYTPIDTVVNELREEAGYISDEIISLGEVTGTKSTDTVYYLYTVDLTNIQQAEKPQGDGTVNEEKAYCYWSDQPMKEMVDPFGYAMYTLVRMKMERREF